VEKIRDLSRQVDLWMEKILKETEFFSSHDDCPTCRQGIAHKHRTQIIDKGNKQVGEIQSGKEKLIQELDTLNARLLTISNISSTITTKNREVSDLLIQVRTWGSFVENIIAEIEKIRNTNVQIDANNEEINKLKEELKQAISSKESLISDKKLYEVAGILLKDSGIKTKIIKQYVPIMNKLINKYLASMDFFVNFELNESFEETIKSRFRDEFSYESFSEGEKSRIDLALLFTWRAVAKLRNSASTNLIILVVLFFIFTL
jgi:DNA repair exonuclease SbcCD ATPase subunit